MVNVVKSNNEVEVEDTKNKVDNQNQPGNNIRRDSNEIIKAESTNPATTFNPPPIPVAANNTQL